MDGACVSGHDDIDEEDEDAGPRTRHPLLGDNPHVCSRVVPRDGDAS